MSDLLNATLGAVGAVGTAADKITGGRALRGALAGKPRELASIVPFSDSMGLTKPEDATSGRDLTDHYNLTTKGDDSFGSHSAGFAADMLASPLSLVSGYGAFKAAPTLAKGAVAAGKALTGLDAIEHAGGALKRFAGFGGKAADVAQGAHAAAPVAMTSYADHTPSLYKTPQHILDAHTGAMPGDDAMSAVRGNNSLLDAYRNTGNLQAVNNPSTLVGRPISAGNDLKFARSAPKPSGPVDSLIQHRPWAGQSGIPEATRNAAEYAGPGYPGGADKMIDLFTGKNTGSDYFDRLKDKVLSHPQLPKIAAELPEDTKFLGHGAEAMTAISGDGHVIRIAPPSPFGSSGRADIPQIVQPYRSIQIPGNKGRGDSSPWVIEHMPKVNPVFPGKSQIDQIKDLVARLGSRGDQNGVAHGMDALKHAGHLGSDAGTVGYDLSQTISKTHPNLDAWDFGGHNISLTNEGNAIGHDGGMAKPWGSANKIVRYSPTEPSPAALEKALKLGGQDAVREAMAGGLARGTVGQGLGASGGVLGLDTVAQRQAVVKGFLDKYGHMANDAPSSLPGSQFQSAPTGAAAMARMPVAPQSPPLSFNDPALWTGNKIPDLNVASGSTPQGGFAIHAGGKEKLSPGLISRLLGGGTTMSPTAQAAASGVELPWQRAVRLGTEAGFRTDKLNPGLVKKIAKVQGWDQSQIMDTPAWYSADLNRIELNPLVPDWHNNQGMANWMHDSGPEVNNWFSSGHPDHLINHEIGHGMHAESVGADRFKNDAEFSTPFTPGGDEHNFFKNTLSTYGATSPEEAIAEITAGLKGGRELNPSLIPALKEWGGPKMFQNLGDHGLLKGLGLSLLGTLGVGGAMAQPQEAGS